MGTRPLKVFAIVAAVVTGIFLLFNYYLPKELDAAGPGIQYRDIVPSQRMSETKKPSIADELGVPRPKTVTYTAFNPSNIKRQKKSVRAVFEVPPEIATEVGFWRDVYTKYDKTKVVFHDNEHMNVIYSVLDISDIENSTRMTDAEKARQKYKRLEVEEDRIQALLRGLQDKDPAEMNEEELRVYHLFDNVNEKNKFKKASTYERIRGQTGIAEKFREGIKVSGRYLGEIEKIFKEYGIPLEIARLPFIESTFDLGVVSKVGASGIWQFMPSTGRLFLTIDQVVDERNDPIAATHGAAQHLIRDYEIVGTWPLAINSYNSGRGRLEKAVSRLKTKDIAKIIKKFDYPGYGFASRNFYPAFLAALEVFENRDKYFSGVEMQPALSFDIIVTPFFATLPELAKYTGVDVEKLVLLNHHFQDRIIAGKLPIPKGFELKVPAGRGEDFLVAMNEIDSLAKYAKWHMVEPGENLRAIATKYKTSTKALRRANHLRRNRLKAGQILKLPKGIALAKE